MATLDPVPSPGAADAPRRRGRRRGRVILWVVAPLLTLLITIPVLALVLDVGGVVRAQIMNMKPDWEQQIGRSIAIGEVKLRLLPSISAEVRDIVIAAQTEKDAGHKIVTGDLPLLRLGAARLGVAVFPLLRGEVRINNIEVQDLSATVVRGPDGRLSYQDILEHLESDKKPSKPLTPEQLAYVKRLSLSRVAVSDAALRFLDLSVVPATTVAITRVNLGAEDVALGRPLLLRLTAAVLAAAPNLDVAVKVALPADLTPDLKVESPMTLLQRLQVKVQPLQLEPLLRFLPPADLQARSALLDCDLTLETPAAAGQLQVKGQLGLRGLTLTHQAGRAAGGAVSKAETVGVPTDLRLSTDLSFALLTGDLTLRELSLAINDMTLRGNADARSLWSAPRVQALALASQGLLLEKLLAPLPPDLLPRGTTLRGPLVLSASGSGDAARADLQAALDLTGATLLLPSLHKPAGTALSATFRGALLQEGGGSSLRIDKLGLVLGPLSLLASGVARSGEVDLKLDTGSVELDPLLRLLPQVQRGVPAGTKISGALQVAATVHKKGPSLNAQARVNLAGADLETSEVALSGAAQLSAKVQASGESATIDADVDLGGAHLLLPGTVDKDRGVPMALHLAATSAGALTTIKTASLKLPGGDIVASGSLRRGAGGSMDLRVPTCDLDLGRLSRVLPVLRTSLPPALADGHLKLQLAVSGDPAALSGARAKLSGFDLRAAGGRIGGEAEVVGLSEPRQVTFRFEGAGMDLSRFAGGEGAKKEASESKSGPVKIPPLLKKMELDGRFHMTDARYRTSPIRDLLLEVTLREGRLVLKTLRGAAFSGQLDASGSTVELGPTPPRFDLKASMTKVELSEVLALRGDSKSKITGRGDLTLTAKGSGLSYEDIAPAVTGALVLGLSQGRLHTTSLVAKVVNPLLEKLQDKVGKQKVSEEMALRDLSARFGIANGRLSTTSPLTLSSDEGGLKLGGWIGLDQRLGLTGELQVAAAAISAASGGRVVPSGPLPVNLRIGGTLSGPEIEVVDLQRTVAALAGMLLKGKAKGILEKLPLPGGLSDRLGGAGGIPTSTEDLQKKAADEAKAAQERATEEARKRAQEAEQRLKDEARKRLGGLGGLLGN